MEGAANRATEPCAGSYGGSAVTAAHVSICYKKRWRMSDYLYLTLDSTDVADNVDHSPTTATQAITSLNSQVVHLIVCWASNLASDSGR